MWRINKEEISTSFVSPFLFAPFLKKSCRAVFTSMDTRNNVE